MKRRSELSGTGADVEEELQQEEELKAQEKPKEEE